jgi:hypothetical protein
MMKVGTATLRPICASWRSFAFDGQLVFCLAELASCERTLHFRPFFCMDCLPLNRRCASSVAWHAGKAPGKHTRRQALAIDGGAPALQEIYT